MLNDTDAHIPSSSTQGDTAHSWGAAAPKGGRAVLQRILREGAKVPLFLGQTLVNSLRDVGYNDTTSAVCEHVDNALQWGATEIRVYFHQHGEKTAKNVDVMVIDNGQGMAPHVLQVATAFGGSMVYENRSSIGRYGVGMKAAALSMSPVMEVYSWQEAKAFYRMVLDVQEISNNRANLIELPEPEFLQELPSAITRILSRAMVYPKNPTESQTLFTDREDEVYERLGTHGTIVLMPNCDRLTYKTPKTLVDHAVADMARVYRRYIERGVAIYVNNRRLEAVDPTFWMLSARHASAEDLDEKRSRLVHAWPRIEVPISEDSTKTAPVSVRLYRLPIEEWSQLPRKTLSTMGVHNDHQVTYMRADREVYVGPVALLKMPAHGDTKWMRLQIDFPSELDEAFGVAMNKQGVRPKRYVHEKILEFIKEDVQAVRNGIAASRATPSRPEKSSGVTGEAERRANASDALQGKALPSPAPETEEEKVILEGNLRGLAVGLKREGESDEEAYQRVNASTYILQFKHDEYWPFYHADYTYGKVILTLNTAHPFYTKLYQPLVKLASAVGLDGTNDEDGRLSDCSTDEVVVALQLLLLSLARTQGQMTSGAEEEERRVLFDTLRRQWSDNLRTQLTVG